MRKMQRLLMITAVLAGALLLAGCRNTVSNNHLTLNDYADHLVACGLPVEQIQGVNPGPAKAVDAMSVKFLDNPNEIGIYRFDRERESDRKRLDMIKADGCLYIVGFKYPALIQGSFVVIGYEKNVLKNQIIAATESFQ